MVSMMTGKQFSKIIWAKVEKTAVIMKDLEVHYDQQCIFDSLVDTVRESERGGRQ